MYIFRTGRYSPYLSFRITIQICFLSASTFLHTALSDNFDVASKELCKPNSTADCSFQLDPTGGSEDICQIYPTNVCATLSLPLNPPVEVLENVEDAPFRVWLQPFLHQKSDIVSSSALNMTLETDNSDVTGLYFLLQESFNAYNSCRIFNFTRARELHTEMTTIRLFYDCYVGLDYHGIFAYEVVLRALPVNKELHYRIFVPPQKWIAPTFVCSWAPVMMVNKAMLAHNRVEARFSVADPKLHVDYYQVKLTRNKSPIQSKKVPASPSGQERMMSVEFQGVPRGKYMLSVIPVAKDGKTICNDTDSTVLEIVITGLIEEPNYSWVYAIILCCVIGFVLFLGYMCFRHCTSPGDNPEFPIPKVLILYSYDCELHMEVVRRFAEYLKNSCKMDIIFDEWDICGQNPAEWIANVVQEVQFIIVVSSQGTRHKIDYGNKPKMPEEHSWRDCFTPGYHHVMNLVHNQDCSNRILKVVFESYTNRRYIPKPLLLVGHTFQLMSQVNNLLCHLHNQPSKYFPVSIYPKMPGSDYQATTEGKALQAAIEKMKCYQKNKPLWFKELLGPLSGGQPDGDWPGEQLGLPSNPSSRAVSPARSPGNSSGKKSSEDIRMESCELLPKNYERT